MAPLPVALPVAPPAPVVPGSSLVERLRTGFTPAALVAGPVLTAIGFTLHETEGANHEEFLTAAAHHALLWNLAHVIIPVGLAFFAAGFAGLLRLAGGRGGRFLVAGTVLGVIGTVATAIDTAAHGAVEAALMNRPDITVEQSERIQLDYMHHSPVVLPLVLLGLGMMLGLLLAGIGLFRSRRVPRWAAVLVLLSPVGLTIAGAGPVAPLGAAPLLVGSVVVARVLARTR